MTRSEASTPTRSHAPLFHARQPDAVVGWQDGRPVDAATFLAAVERIAAGFAPGRHVLNLCTDRLGFAAGFCATVLSNRISLQPPNHSPATIADLRQAYPDLQILSSADIGEAVDAGFPFAIPQIPAERVAALVFTSGSTGRPTAHVKRWGSLVANVRAAAARLGFDPQTRPTNAGATTVIGTVPPQHMYGFESTVLLSLHAGLILHAGTPFYPADIAATLADAPGARVLVTTPFHLRTLLAEGGPLPAVDLLLCATAPLTPELAADAERRFSAPLMEIYGCTEAGQIASRRPTRGDSWHTFRDVRIDTAPDADGQPVWSASGGHVDVATPLSDLLVLEGPDRFRLVGRQADLVNIAGKRSSLAHLNQLLLGIDGIRDGAFHLPTGDGRDIVRLTAFYVSDRLEPADVLAALRDRTDPVFLPRPLYRVDALPRAATGKLPQAALAELAARLRTDRERR